MSTIMNSALKKKKYLSASTKIQVILTSVPKLRIY